ncbi:MAG: hypothetical protein CVU43_04025 [Chloroflexi bacterium HGW-Chloroflexi-5]|jgi:tRNA A-37 threonylcarbamoyl transferase component Bud32|nr:MAG: hypothetical protein CVU43_04025 [Chloroflexi bacterium HGW-Chloroflexi-5]
MEPYSNQLFGLDFSTVKELLQSQYFNEIQSINYEDSDHKVGMPGICGEYAIPKFEITTDNGTETVVLFGRRQLSNTESKQAHHYRYLSESGIPVPKLYGAINDGNNCEILVLEYAQEITDEKDFFSEEKNITEFIDLAAKFSSMHLSHNYIGLIGKDMGNKSDTRDWKTWMSWSVFIIEKIWDLASHNKLGIDLKKMCEDCNTKNKLQRIAFNMIKKIGSFDIGIAHSDFRPNNMVHLNNHKLGLIDFEDVIIDSKFYDIARYLGAPDQVFKWEVTKRDYYIDFFIDKCKKYEGKKLNQQKMRDELFHIWYTRSINMWEWLPHEYGGPAYDFWPAGKNSEERCQNLSVLLNALIHNSDRITIN